MNRIKFHCSQQDTGWSVPTSPKERIRYHTGVPQHQQDAGIHSFSLSPVGVVSILLLYLQLPRGVWAFWRARQKKKGSNQPCEPLRSGNSTWPENRAMSFPWPPLWTLSPATVKQHLKQSTYKMKMFEVLVHDRLVLSLWSWEERPWQEYTVG